MNPLYLGGTEAIRRLVMAGIGIGWLSRLSITPELESGKLVPLPLPELVIHRPFYQIRHAQRGLSRTTRAFVGLLQKVTGGIVCG